LYGEGYTIRGVQRILREQGSKFVEAVWREGAPQPPHGAMGEELYAEEEKAEPLPVSEKPGLLGRLIGRDLGDKEDDARERVEPPLEAAPVPRIEPSDRTQPEPAMVPPPQPAAQPAVQPGLGRDDLRKLHAALHELGECRKLIDTALASN
jgi:hypothetical protein